MRTGWVAVAAVIFASGGALAVKPVADAERHLTVARVGIQSAELNVKGLYTLAERSDQYSQTHAQILMKNLGDSISLAETHLAELPPLAIGSYSDALAPMETAKGYLMDAKSLLEQLHGTANMTPDRVKDWAARIYKDLEAARKSFDKTTKDFGQPTNFKTPG